MEECQWAIIGTGNNYRMERYIRICVGLVKWLIMNILVSPFLHRYFEVPVVDFLLEVFGYGAHDGERAPEEDVESARNTADRSA